MKRITGVEWSHVQARGLTWLLEELVLKCTFPVDRSDIDQRRAI